MKGLFQCPPRVAPWVNTDANKSPCKGKSFEIEGFCPYRATLLYLFKNPGRCPGLGAFGLSARLRLPLFRLMTHSLGFYPMQLVTPSVVAIAVSMLMAICRIVFQVFAFIFLNVEC